MVTVDRHCVVEYLLVFGTDEQKQDNLDKQQTNTQTNKHDVCIHTPKCQNFIFKKNKTLYCILKINIMSLESKFQRKSIRHHSSGQTNMYVFG